MGRLERYKDTDATPYICKDYRESGYCTWGSSCIYAHIRGESPIKKDPNLDQKKELLKRLNKNK